MLGCKLLPRPPFTFGGAWLKAGRNLTIHLIQQASERCLSWASLCSAATDSHPRCRTPPCRATTGQALSTGRWACLRAANEHLLKR